MTTTLEWQDLSACGPGDSELFWPDTEADRRDLAEVEKSVKEATAHLCGECPVAGQCLEYGIEFDSVGVFGGATTDERRALAALSENSRRRLAEVRDADALETAAAVYSAHGPDERDIAGLSASAIQTIWGVTRAAARARRIGGQGPSTSRAVLETLADGKPHPRDDVIDEVARVVALNRPDVNGGGRNAARAAVIRLESDGRIVPADSGDHRMVMLADSAASQRRNGSTFTKRTAVRGVAVSGVESRFRLRPGARIRADIAGSEERGYRVDLIAEGEQGSDDPFLTVAGIRSIEEAQQRAVAAVESLGVVLAGSR